MKSAFHVAASSLAVTISVAGDRGKGALGFRSGAETGVVEVRRVGDFIGQAARKRLCGCHGCCGHAENFAEIATTHFDSSCCGRMHEYGYSKPAYSTHREQEHGMVRISIRPGFPPGAQFWRRLRDTLARVRGVFVSRVSMRAGAEVPLHLVHQERMGGAAGLLFLARNAHAVSRLDRGYVPHEGIAQVIAFILDHETVRA